MITEKDISKKIGRTIKSPIRMGNVRDLGFSLHGFLEMFKPCFEDLQDDAYLVRGKQIEFLKSIFPTEVDTIEQHHQSYFEGREAIEILNPWIKRLSEAQLKELEQLSMITRQRNISSFLIEIWDDQYFIERTGQQGFQQNVGDFRGWRREFMQASKEAVENELFQELLKKITGMVRKLHPKARKFQITSHFMRTLSQAQVKGENAPEGVHEDGAQYIMSALVINRQNVVGGESQIYEKQPSGNQMIYNKILEPGEFIFQADTGEEFTFGNDLWHYVTPIGPFDESQLGIRDIIGFDIDILA